MTLTRFSICRIAAGAVLMALPFVATAYSAPAAGDTAPDFELNTLTDQPVKLSSLTSDANVVLLVLRGWPGYQCPICSRQVHDFLTSAPAFKEANARIVMVYPGPSDDLKAHADEFQDAFEWPGHFTYLLDPDYTMINAYGLRWDAPRETAYPSTFVLDRSGTVRFAKISDSHGGRTSASDVLAEIKKLNE